MTTLLIDGNNFAYANYHTHRELQTSEGEGTGLVYGTLAGMLTLAKLFPGSPMILVWDGPGKSWRRERCPERYKAQRNYDNGVREDCQRQMRELKCILEILQLPQIGPEAVEADDTLGILAVAISRAGEEVVIRSSDKDFYQLLGPKVRILRGLWSRKRMPTADTVQSVLVTDKKIPQGIPPGRWTTFRALCGDPSDNLKGLVTGCGEKAASVLVASGIKLPSYGSPTLRKVSRLSSKEITQDDWKRVNENYELSTILTDPSDVRLTEESRKEIQKFIQQWSKTRFKRKPEEIDEWRLIKRLGRMEMTSLLARTKELLRLY